MKPGGYIIFTPHDKDQEEKHQSFWKEQEQIWTPGQQNAKLFEFGDLITTSKNEAAPIFIPIPNKSELVQFVRDAG